MFYYYAPADLLADPLYRNSHADCDNLALLLGRFVSFTGNLDRENGSIKIDTHWIGSTVVRIKGRSARLAALCDRNRDEQLLLLAQCHQLGESVHCFDMRTEGSFLPGLGIAHINENGLSLDHITGLPRLPGSGVKGIARVWYLDGLARNMDVDLNCVEKLFELEGLEHLLNAPDREESRNRLRLATAHEGRQLPEELLDLVFENEDYRNELITGRALFGTPEMRGQVTFFDAIPLRFKIVADIMTPHYGRYYRQEGAPLDSDTPNPISFFALADACFRFSLLSRDTDLLDRAVSLLRQALENLGAGAKTAVGYGYFGNYSDQSHLPAQKTEELARRQALAAMPPLKRFRSLLAENGAGSLAVLGREWLNGEVGKRDQESDRGVADFFLKQLLALPSKKVTAGMLDIYVYQLLKLLPETHRITDARHLLKHSALSRPEFRDHRTSLQSHIPREKTRAAGDDELIATLRSGDGGKISNVLGRAIKVLQRKTDHDSTFICNLAEAVTKVQPAKAIKKKTLVKARCAAEAVLKS